jgi:hypothetical protein
MTSEDGARYSKSNAWIYRLGQDFMTGSSDIRLEQIWTGWQCQGKSVLCLSIFDRWQIMTPSLNAPGLLLLRHQQPAGCAVDIVL